jgi:hypothetical protein
MSEMRTCAVCGRVYSGDREITCSDDCHTEMVSRFVAEFGEFKKVVRTSTGVAYKVPTRDILECGIKEQDLDRYPPWDDSLRIALANGRTVNVSQSEVGEFITRMLIPDAYWRHSGQLTGEEMARFLKGESNHEELKKITRYILAYTENLAFGAYLFAKADGRPDESEEFNMPVVKKLRDLYQKAMGEEHTLEGLSQIVNEMGSVCREIGADPL